MVEINDESRVAYDKKNPIKLKTLIMWSNLWVYSNACTLVSVTITITGKGANDSPKESDERNKGVIFKNCAPFTECISNIINTQLENAKHIDFVMPMYNLIEYNDNY